MKKMIGYIVDIDVAMDFCSVNTRNHLLLPLGYNRVKRCVKQLAPVLSARAQAEVHAIALGFVSTLLYIPRLYEVRDSYYVTEFILHANNNIVKEHELQNFPKLFVELFRFKDYMMKEGYFVRGLKLCKIGDERWAVFDFSQYGHISNKRVKFPKNKWLFTLDQAEWDYGLKYRKGFEEDPYNGLYD